jgi:transcriptional regulator with XRE-family HTH domain
MRPPTSGPKDDGLPLTEVFGANVRRVRVQRELSVLALAQRCGFSIEFVDLIEKGQAPEIGLDEIVVLAKALGVEPEDLVSRHATE